MMNKLAEGFRLRLLGGIAPVHKLYFARLRKRRHPSANLFIISLVVSIIV